jgi:hypothetical protein
MNEVTNKKGGILNDHKPPKNDLQAITLTELNSRPGKVIRGVLRTQKPVQISEYGEPIVEIRPLPTSESEGKNAGVESETGHATISQDIRTTKQPQKSRCQN